MSVSVKKGISTIAVIVLMATLAVFAAGCGSSSEAAGKYIAGTYTGEGKGMAGTIEVTLTVDNNAITSVDKIVDPGETVGIGGKEAIEDGTFVNQIMEAQSADIDGATGATLTTDGVKSAVEDALNQAASSAE